MRFNNGFKDFKQKNDENQPKPKPKRFSPVVSVLIVGAIVITAFFRGTVSHILLIILFAGCGLYKLAACIKSRRLRDKQRLVNPPWRKTIYNGHTANNRYNTHGRRRNPSYRRNSAYNRNISPRNNRFKPSSRKYGRFGHGQNKIVR